MKIRWRVNNEWMTINVEESELTKGNWLNLEVVENETEEDFRIRVQQEIHKQYNRPEYNNWHRLDRNTTSIERFKKESMDNLHYYAKDKSKFERDVLSWEQNKSYADVEEFLKAVLRKEELVDAFLTICVKRECSIRQYVIERFIEQGVNGTELDKAVKKKENALSKQLARAKEKLKNNFSKMSDFGISCGY